MAGRPLLIHGNSQLLFGGMGRLPENTVINIKNKSHSVTAQIVVPNDGGDGVLVAQGGQFGGWVLYVHEGRPAYCYNLFGAQRFKVYGNTTLDAGEHQVRAEFDYDGGGIGKGGTVTLYIDGEAIGEGRVEGTQPMLFSADETTDVGHDTATSVTDDFTSSADTRYPGRVRWVQIDLGDDAEDADHFITPEERLRIAMAIQ
jgi:arylsulfatase